MKPVFVTLAALLIAGVASADVQVRIRDLDGGISTISSNGRLARIDDASRGGFVIVDFDSNETRMVDPARGQVMVTRLEPAGAAAADAVDPVQLKDLGNGPRIAGYTTRHLQWLAGGNLCGDIYVSSVVSRNRSVMALFEAMRGMQRMARAMAAAMRGMMNPCERAGLDLADALEDRGVPMKVIDVDGKPLSEVLEIDVDKRLAGDYYAIPAGLVRVDTRRQLDEAMRQSGQMIKQLPDMGRMMQQLQQLQQDGQPANEQVQQQLEQMQQMLQKLQSQ